VAKKTKEELREELSTAIEVAKAQYNSTVKPAQEKYKLREQHARILLEQTEKSLEKFTQIIGFTETKSPITGKVAQTPSGIIYLESDVVQQYQKVIDAAEDAYRKVRENAMSDYYKIEKPAKAEKFVAIRLANSHFCGNSEVRTGAGLNKVKYRLKHPNAGFWSTLLGRNWKYACQDCADYIVRLWGHAEMKPVGLPVVDRDLDYHKMVVLDGKSKIYTNCFAELLSKAKRK